MAIAAWLVWRKVGLTAAPMQLFLLQLLLNVTWSALVFRLRSPGLRRNFHVVVRHRANIDRILESSSGRRLVAVAILGVSYAAALNFSIWWLNA